MKRLIVLFFFISVLTISAQTKESLETKLRPSPPYSPGTKVEVTISGPGVKNLSFAAHFRLVGKGVFFGDIIISEAVAQEGQPPAYKWSFTAPEIANTSTPTLEVQVHAKDGSKETLTAKNTPAFAQIKFTGIKVDTTDPEISNLRFSQPSAGNVQLSFDVNDTSLIEDRGGTVMIAGVGFGLLNTNCKGKIPQFKCISEISIPPMAQGSIEFSLGIADQAGNTTNIKKSFNLAKIAGADTSDPKLVWPVRTALCSDAVMRSTFDVSGGAGLFEGKIAVRAKELILTDGVAEISSVHCSGNKCESTMTTPHLVGLPKDSLTATVGSKTSGSSVGGKTAENFLVIELIGNNGRRVEHKLPESVLKTLTTSIPDKGKPCRVFNIAEKGEIKETIILPVTEEPARIDDVRMRR